MSTLTDQDLDSIEQEASSSRGDYGRAPKLLALVTEVRQHRSRVAVHAVAHPERLREADVELLRHRGIDYADRGNRCAPVLGADLAAAMTEILQRRDSDLTEPQLEQIRAMARDAAADRPIVCGPERVEIFLDILRAHGVAL